MKRTAVRGTIAALALASTLMTAPAWADGTNSKGIITAHTGNTLNVRDANNVKQVISLQPDSTEITARGKSDLMAFAQTAKDTKGFQITVQDFTDSTGNAATNERLSRARAQKVESFLQRNGGLSTARVHSGDGMGVVPDAGTGDNKGARKVTVRLYVDKGVAAVNEAARPRCSSGR